MKNIRLGDLLIELGYITPDQLTAALAYQKEHRDLRVGQALQELGYVNERQVLEALAKRLQIQLIDIEHTTVDVTAVEKVPQELAQKYDMLPVAQSARTLTVAANDPLNYYAIEDIRQNCNPRGSASTFCKIEDPVVVKPETVSNQAFITLNSPPQIR